MILSDIKKLFFYRHIFTLSSISKGCLVYLSYWVTALRAPFRPLTINFLITSFCNFTCDICSFYAHRGVIPNGISLQDMERFCAAQVKSRPFIFFSGGEPFTRGDFIEILNVVKKYKLKCGVNTNAFLLDEVKIKRLVDLKVELIVFSLYGPMRIHDSITGTDGSYDRAVKNIALYCKNKSKLSKVIISCTITKENLDYLEDLPGITKSLGADAVKFEHLNFLSKSEAQSKEGSFMKDNVCACGNIIDFSGKEDEFCDKLISKLTVIKRLYGDFVLVKPDLSYQEIRNWYSGSFSSDRKCFFVWHSVFIRPDGAIVPCQYLLDYETGNIKEDKIDDIFCGDKMFILRKRLKEQLLPECKRCCKL